MSAFTYLKADYGEVDTLPFTNGTGSELSGGDLHQVGDKVGVVYEDTPDTEDGLLLVGVPAPGIEVPKESVAFSPGEVVRYDSANDAVDADASTPNPIVGHAYKDAASGDARVQAVLTNENVA